MNPFIGLFVLSKFEIFFFFGLFFARFLQNMFQYTKKHMYIVVYY